jgi:hypothetical protein
MQEWHGAMRRWCRQLGLRGLLGLAAALRSELVSASASCSSCRCLRVREALGRHAGVA